VRPPNQDVTSIQLAFDWLHESCASAPQHKRYAGVFHAFICSLPTQYSSERIELYRHNPVVSMLINV